jgi:hypothetical protein
MKIAYFLIILLLCNNNILSQPNEDKILELNTLYDYSFPKSTSFDNNSTEDSNLIKKFTFYIPIIGDNIVCFFQ